MKGQLVFGLGLVIVATLALWIARPSDGEVRHRILRSENVQTYFTIFIVGSFAVGIVNIIAGLAL